ncbi:hypothetical protein [Paenibacillus sp. S150]|uniref:hypothetical protein n=1 Tax=Paenibacillus sp. S150 TaxID=2749826 RepID=UPI001C568649|nr:hypothetical protein [Paenibacillus sp. S150]
MYGTFLWKAPPDCMIADTQNIHFIVAAEGSEVKMVLHGKAMQEVKPAHELDQTTLLVRTVRKSKFNLGNDVVLSIHLPGSCAAYLSI